ncbi:MAG: aldehyde dehydrogenase family protein, partial [Casimicrobiaceae bacterium]
MAPEDSNTRRNQLPLKRQHYYGGAWHASASGGEMPVGSPATGESLGSVSVGDAVDVDRAVRSAQEGFERWRDTPAQERAACIRRAIAVMRAHAEELAWIDAVDTGN